MNETPGPWTVTVRRGRVIVLDANRNEVCDAFAEAPLIAAAPQLKLALELCARVLSDLPSTSKAGTQTRAAYDAAIGALRQTEGEQ